MNDPVLGLVGFAKKSGNLAIGRSAVENARRRGMLFLVIIAKDASDKVTRGIGGMQDVPVYKYGDKNQYSQLLDREVAVLGIMEKQFAQAMMKKLPGNALTTISKNDKSD